MHASAAPRTILVLDDDDAFRDTVVDALAAIGHRVLAAPGIEAGLAILEAERAAPALIVMAWILPAVKSLELLGALAGERRWTAIPVVVLAEPATQSRVPAHAAAVLNRPPRLRTLLDVIARLSGAAPAPAHVVARHGRARPTLALRKPIARTLVDVPLETGRHRGSGPT
jgi:CheY-like chemotaxis protein